MITNESAAESVVPTVPKPAAASETPELEEPAWPWKDAPIRALVQRILQLQAERAQAFRWLEENQCLPHSGPGTLPGGLSGGRCGYRAWGRRLRTPTCRRGHRQYLRSGPPYDFPRYRSKVHEVTQAFAAVSREVLAVEAELAGPRAQPLLAGHVRSLQQLEQTRLATVALLQLMRVPELTGQEDTLQMHQLKMKVIKTMEAISEVLQDLRFDAESVE
ncbi:required for excision 1-B domain-containing protein isoform X2 [Pteropus alecto]|uniref:required for excision 1-B domain-containing protein isoform X2 n=1 Tax=Pteropus alecto TaxID=9402 RepID=UPI0003F1869D|nr:required for excision 1-B domain-containing protein isoform X2 [Pteropus alecto]XP_039723840.1 required for excision 1-B domain-containing protein isoform X1 [Pteropus giganteus]